MIDGKIPEGQGGVTCVLQYRYEKWSDHVYFTNHVISNEIEISTYHTPLGGKSHVLTGTTVVRISITEAGDF